MNQSPDSKFKPAVRLQSKNATQPLANGFLSTRHLAIYISLLLIFAGAAQPITDSDFWWHLRTGQYIVATKAVPHTDIFSAMRFGSEWVAHEWLSEVFTYSVFRWLGYGGLIVIFSALVTATFWLVYQRCRRRMIHPYVVVIALLLGAVASISTWGVRPHVFSFFLAALYLNFLDKYSHREESASIWWLVPLMILWANLHAGFVIGLVLIFLTAVGLTMNRLLLPGENRQDDWRRIGLLFALLIVCAAVVILNPNGTRLYSYPLETLTSPAMMRYIEEWKSPNFHEARFQGLALLLIATSCALALSRKRIRPSELLLLAFGAWITLRAARNVWFFVLVATPLLAEHLWLWLTSYSSMEWLTRPEKSDVLAEASAKILVNITLLIVCVTLVGLGVRRAVAGQAASEAELVSPAAIDYLRYEKLPQPIFNEYDWGGYLIWKAYPDYRVYIDGRADVYGDKILDDYILLHNGKPGWRELLDGEGIKTVVIRPDIPLASLLRLDNVGWQKAFEDPQTVIFVRR